MADAVLALWTILLQGEDVLEALIRCGRATRSAGLVWSGIEHLMRLYKDLKHASARVASLIQAILIRIPLLAFACVFLHIASQLSKMAAFLIPIKALFVAGADDVPRYIISFLGDVEKEELVIALAAIAVGLYIVHLAIDALRGILDQCAVKQLLEVERVSLIESSSLHFTRLFEQAPRVLSAIIFSGAILCALSMLVDGLVESLGLYTFATFVVYSAIYQVSALARKESAKQLPIHVGVISALGFLGGFGIILLQVLTGRIETVILAVLGLVLLRLLMNQVSSGFKAAFVLNTNFPIYDHLLSGSVFQKQNNNDQDIFESFNSNDLDFATIVSASGLANTLSTFGWVDSGLKGVAMFHADLVGGGRVLVKVYATGTQSAADREHLILREESVSALSAEVLAEYKYEGRSVRIFDRSQAMPLGANEFKQARGKFLAELMACEPSKQVCALSTKMRVPIHRRVDLVRLVKTLVNSGTLSGSFDGLCANWPLIQTRLDHCPEQLVVKCALGTLGLREGRGIVCLHWENWTIEPVGAVWEGGNLPGDMQALADSARQIRPSLHQVPVEQMQIVHALCRIEVAKSRQHFASCAEVVLQIDTLVKALVKPLAPQS